MMKTGALFLILAILLALAGFTEGVDAGLRSLGVLAVGCLCGVGIGTVAYYLSPK